MRKLVLCIVCLAAMMAAGTGLKAQEVTIVLNPGWTWISYPNTDTVDIATAFGSFTPEVGDIFKSKWGMATYIGNGQWRGAISPVFYPGYGYHYKSNRQMPVVVTVNVQQPAPQVVVTTLEPTDIATNSATCGGNVASSNGDYVSVTLRGVCWGTNPNPTFNDNFIEAGNGLGSFTISMTELTPNTTFYVRAFAVTANETVYGNEISFTTMNVPTGAINGLFSVNANQQVYFSQGNLQYQPSTNIWRFAENQYDMCDVGEVFSYYIWDDDIGDYVNVSVEEYNAYIAQGGWNCYLTYDVSTQYTASYSGWIDLFGWGTSGYNHGANCYQPWSTSLNYSDYYAYGSYIYNLYDQTGKADWGYNPIINGGNSINQWRTLTQSEWDYIFNIRITTSGIRYAKAQVNNINGVILLPDNWSTSTHSLINTNNSGASFVSNIINSSQWVMLENAGAIFLPAEGSRVGTSIECISIGNHGAYLSATCCNKYSAYSLGFDGGALSVLNNYALGCGQSVRLVYSAE